MEEGLRVKLFHFEIYKFYVSDIYTLGKILQEFVDIINN
jgi:hypothetical protein